MKPVVEDKQIEKQVELAKPSAVSDAVKEESKS